MSVLYRNVIEPYVDDRYTDKVKEGTWEKDQHSPLKDDHRDNGP